MVTKYAHKKKISLVLSGGGIKAAAFHIGVCLALKEKGFRFAGGSAEMVKHQFSDDWPLTIRQYVGSSAGAFIASILASGYDAESLVNAFQVGIGDVPMFDNKDLQSLKPITYSDMFNLDAPGLAQFIPDFFFKKSLFSGGLEALLKKGLKVNSLFSTKGLEKYLRKDALIYNDFFKLGVELYIVATQLNHTRKALFSAYPETYKTNSTYFINYASISEAVACSASLPPVFSPYGLKTPEGQEIYFYDGEIRETLSTHVATDHGADLVIASHSVQPYHFTKEVGSLHKFGFPVILNQALYQVIEQKIEKQKMNQIQYRQLYQDVSFYCQKHQIPENEKQDLLGLVQKNLNYKHDADYIFIHPSPQNYEMFFADHFSLNPKILFNIVRAGFKATLTALKQ
ncbi:MAG: patatin-like phospholipase family protein [Pseudobdellovibrionaceae bacterium]